MLENVTELVAGGDYLVIALLMFAENIFPPIPSELIMPLAGFSAASGELHLLGVIVAGTAGSLLGAAFWYLVGRWVSAERLRRLAAEHGRWLTISPEEVDQVDDWFDRHGGKAVLLGRLLPGIRTLISVPAGLTGMSVPRFLIYSTLGTVVWTAFLATAGYWLGEQYDRVASWVNPVGTAVIAAIVLTYLYRVATFRKNGRA